MLQLYPNRGNIFSIPDFCWIVKHFFGKFEMHGNFSSIGVFSFHKKRKEKKKRGKRQEKRKKIKKHKKSMEILFCLCYTANSRVFLSKTEKYLEVDCIFKRRLLHEKSTTDGNGFA